MAVFATLLFVEGSRFRKFFTDYVVFDTETTDLDLNACEVIELAAVRVEAADAKILEAAKPQKLYLV